MPRKKIYPWDRLVVTKTYKRGKRKGHKITWQRTPARKKRGFNRYSTGPKWSGRCFPENPAFWRTYQVKWKENFRDGGEILSNGYSVHSNWIALCKSWNGFLMGKREDNYENMIQYATQIRTIQKVLNLPLNQFDLFTPEEMMEIEMNSDLDSHEDRYATTVP